jgi:hypothetical protein
MHEWSLLLIAASLLAIVGLFGMAGCGYPDFQYGTPPNPDLVSEWKLGEASGTTAADSAGSQPGTYKTIQLTEQPQSPATAAPPVLTLGSAGLLQGTPAGSSISVDGGYVEIPFASALNTLQFTVMAWCLPTFDLMETVGGQKAFRSVLASREGNGVQPAGFMIYSGPDLSNAGDTTLYWQAWVGDGTKGGSWTMLIGPAVVQNQTTHLALTYDGMTLKLFVNGSNDGMPIATKSTGYSPNTSTSFYLGMGAPDAAQPAYPFKGRLQDVRYYKAAQSADTIDGVVQDGIS